MWACEEHHGTKKPKASVLYSWISKLCFNKTTKNSPKPLLLCINLILPFFPSLLKPRKQVGDHRWFLPIRWPIKLPGASPFSLAGAGGSCSCVCKNLNNQVVCWSGIRTWDDDDDDDASHCHYHYHPYDCYRGGRGEAEEETTTKTIHRQMEWGTKHPVSLIQINLMQALVNQSAKSKSHGLDGLDDCNIKLSHGICCLLMRHPCRKKLLDSWVGKAYTMGICLRCNFNAILCQPCHVLDLQHW